MIFRSGDEATATIQVVVNVEGKINTPSVVAEVYPQSVGAGIGVSVHAAHGAMLEDLNCQTSFCYHCLIQGGIPTDGLKVYQNKYPSSALSGFYLTLADLRSCREDCASLAKLRGTSGCQTKACTSSLRPMKLTKFQGCGAWYGR